MMLHINKQQQQVIKRVLVKRPRQCRANQTLLKFAEQGIGTKASNNTIRYTQADFNNFEALLSKLDISQVGLGERCEQQVQTTGNLPSYPINPIQKGSSVASQNSGQIADQNSSQSFSKIDGQSVSQIGEQSKNLAASRLQTAQTYADEKRDRTPVFGSQILVVGMQCPIPLIRPSQTDLSSQSTQPKPGAASDTASESRCQPYQMPATPIGVLPTVLASFLDYQRIQKLIIIENGQLMTHWWQWRPALPRDWQQAVLLYRGHGSNLAWLNQMLPKLSATCEVLLCFDIDLAGLRMMSHYARLCSGKVSALLPQDVVAGQSVMANYHAYNQVQKITLQLPVGQDASAVPDDILLPLRPIYQTLVSNNLALMQEHILQDSRIRWMPLVLVS